jgi:HSP20 family protein
MLVQWTPFSNLARLQSQFDHAFDSARGQLEEAYRPAVDIVEDADKILITADLPGVAEEQVALQVDKNVLTFKGERKLARTPDDNGRYERNAGAFERSFRIPPSVDVEKISAAMKDGVLTLSLPKKPQVKPRQIKINS